MKGRRISTYLYIINTNRFLLLSKIYLLLPEILFCGKKNWFLKLYATITLWISFKWRCRSRSQIIKSRFSHLPHLVLLRDLELFYQVDARLPANACIISFESVIGAPLKKESRKRENKRECILDAQTERGRVLLFPSFLVTESDRHPGRWKPRTW